MTIKYERMNPDSLATIRRGGHVTMAQVVTVEGAKKYIYLSGQVSRDAQGNCIGAGDMRAQMIQVGECIIAGLKAVGATMADVVKTTTFVTDMAEYLKHADLRFRYFGNPISASTTIEVKGLVDPDLMIEIEVVAMV
jgi:enamine deaminase RidA (YjgF/YER057c/UK114 family)